MFGMKLNLFILTIELYKTLFANEIKLNINATAVSKLYFTLTKKH